MNPLNQPPEMSEAAIQKQRQQIAHNASSPTYHTLLPICVQQALKAAVKQYPGNEMQKRIAIDEATTRAQRQYARCFHSTTGTL